MPGMAPRKPRAPRPKRPKAPPKGAPGQLLGTKNKAHDLLPDDLAATAGWLGKDYAYPPGPPYPWEDLLPDEAALFERAVGRLTTVLVPKKAALAMCWGGGDWRDVCTKIVNAADVECYPARHHVRLIPRPSIRQLLGLPDEPQN